MASNRLMVNPPESDVLWCSTSQPPPDTPLLPAGTTVQPSANVRNLGVQFDADLSLARCYISLRRIKSSCRRALSRNASVTLINSLISLSQGWTIAAAFSLAATSNSSTNFNAY